MLYIVTGDVQIGKTRWLAEGVRCARACGTFVCGVIAPGVWRTVDEAVAESSLSPDVRVSRFSRGSDGILREKLGIDNILWPQDERISFAHRADLVEREGSCGSCTQSGRAKLGWAIDDHAIARVNDHFGNLQADLDNAAPGNGIVVVDELGRLELLAGGGLTEAVSLLAQGPYPACPTAVVVVRDSLVSAACDILSSRWDIEIIETLSCTAQDSVFGLSGMRCAADKGAGDAR